MLCELSSIEIVKGKLKFILRGVGWIERLVSF